MHDIAAAPLQRLLAVIGPESDGATRDIRNFLERNSVEYDSIAPKDPSHAYRAIKTVRRWDEDIGRVVADVVETSVSFELRTYER